MGTDIPTNRCFAPKDKQCDYRMDLGDDNIFDVRCGRKDGIKEEICEFKHIELENRKRI